MEHNMNEFDQVIERRGTHCMKWDATKERFGEEDLLPLWVADMDFKAPEPVIKALKEKVEHGVYGYAAPSTEVDETIVHWVSSQYNWQIDTEDIVHVTGVVPAISNLIKTFTEEEDEIVIQTPVYYPFYDVIEKNNRRIVKNPLTFDGNQYRMDFAGLESVITEKTKMLILCHPHNPGGRVWSKEELLELADLCEKHDLFVVSDEIHADLLFDGYTHTPLASVSETIKKRVFTTLAPTKTFNLAGVQGAYVVITEPNLRLAYRRTLATTFMNGANMFSHIATKAAYEHGLPWLRGLMSYIQANYTFVEDYLQTHMPKIKPIKPEGTYLLWLNCEALEMSADDRKTWLLQEAKVALNHGPIFGEEGEHFERMNLATPRATLAEAMERIRNAYEKKGL
ncbi:MalY/PatB family protein [Shouchella patagoniensis]|uniref:MalY/PatB family protein n=1 Tax=Shouchella patagoniensis TaxID=228576 RepID=UPI001FECBCA3|nr:MalY/PatB family protein [Shouchella patagoniensis]